MSDYEQTEQDVRDIERRIEEPPDEPHPRYDDEAETCVVCGRVIEPAARYFNDDGHPRHMLCDERGF
jgi:predicted molibdopterin-dependent oxidoreductase YjgC